MKKFPILVFFIVMGLQVRASFGAEPIPEELKQANPQYYTEYVKYSYNVSLTPKMRKALKAYNPTFKILKMSDFAEELRIRLSPDSSNLSCYSAIFGDFNGDGQIDAAVLGEGDFYSDGENGKEKYFPLLAIISGGAAGYHVLEITSIGASKPVTTAISLAKPGKITEACGGPTFEMKNYGITETIGYSSTVYYWDDTQKKFVSVAAGGC